MKVQSHHPGMRAFVLATFVVDGVAAVALIASIAFGDRQITPFDALLVAALLLGFFSALAVIIDGSGQTEVLAEHAESDE